MSFFIDNFHPLSSYSLCEKRKSVMNTVFKKMLYSPNRLDNIFEPYDLKNTFSIRFELELHSNILLHLKKIYEILDLKLDKEYSTVLCLNVSGPFHTIMGIDSFYYGWNKVGLCFQKENHIMDKVLVYPIFEFLIQFFYKYYHFQPFYGKTLDEISILKEKYYIQKNVIVQESELDEIYNYEKLYPNSFLFIIQKIWRGKIRVWEQLKILKEIKSIVYRSIQIPEIDDMKCNNNLLYLYYNGKLKLPRKIRDTLQYFEEIQLTDCELEMYQNYSPFFQENKSSIRIDKNHPLHPEYHRIFSFDGFKMTSILQYIHFQILLPFCSKEKAYQSSFHLTSSLWDEILTDFFKKKYYSEVNLKMKNIKNRLVLLGINEKNIENKDYLEPVTGYKDNFLGKLLQNSRKEMNDYLLPSNHILQESILYMLDIWLSLWKKCLKERHIIDFFFQLWFPFIEQKSIQETEIIYPIHLSDSDNHDYIYSYLSSNIIVDKEINIPHMMKVWKKNLNDDSISFFLSNISSFQYFTEDMKYYFEFDFSTKEIEFNDENNLSLLSFVSFDYFILKN